MSATDVGFIEDLFSSGLQNSLVHFRRRHFAVFRLGNLTALSHPIQGLAGHLLGISEVASCFLVPVLLGVMLDRRNHHHKDEQHEPGIRFFGIGFVHCSASPAELFRMRDEVVICFSRVLGFGGKDLQIQDTKSVKDKTTQTAADKKYNANCDKYEYKRTCAWERKNTMYV